MSNRWLSDARDVTDSAVLWVVITLAIRVFVLAKKGGR